MNDPVQPEEGNDVSKINKWVKLVVGILTLIAIIGGGVWTATTTVAMKPEVKAVELKVTKVELKVEENALIAQNLLQTIQEDRMKSGIRFWQQQLDLSIDKERDIRNGLQKNPNDQNLRDKLQEELRKQQLYKQKLDKLME